MNDLSSIVNSEISLHEKYYRCQLAALCRLADLYGWSNSIFSQISLRLHSNEILINPFGLLFYEVTASSLVKIDLNGNIINPGVVNLGLNAQSAELHTTIHSARADAVCLIYLQTPSIVAISSCTEGLVPISPLTNMLGDISYHEYHGLNNNEDKTRLKNDLGQKNKILVLKNNGIICIGESIEELFSLAYKTVTSSMTQISCSLSANNSNLKTIHTEKIPDEADISSHASICALEYEAHMRFMDRLGYHTGYNYTKLSPHIAHEYLSKKNSSTQLSSASEYGSECINRQEVYDSSRSQSDFREHSALSELSDSSFPHSESSKELFMCMSYRIHSDVSTTTSSCTPDISATQPTTPITKRPKSYSKRQNLQRRSKSLTSGVEKAIFRKITEKYMSELR